MLQRRLVRLCMAIVVSGLFSAVVMAQGQLTLHINQIDTSAFPQVAVRVSAVNPDGLPITNLEARHFSIQENGQARDISKSEVIFDLPVRAVLAIDVSGSMAGNKLDAARQAALAFMDRLGPTDYVAVVAFGDSVDLTKPIRAVDSAKELDFTLDHGAARNLINSLITRAGIVTTPLYDATYKSVAMAASQPPGNRAVILLTDGREEGKSGAATSSLTKENDAIEEANQARIPVFTIGLGRDADQNYLRRVALRTGGTFSYAPTPAELPPLFTTIVEQLKMEYLLVYQAGIPADGKAYTLDVKVSPAAGTEAIAKSEISVRLDRPRLRMLLFRPAGTAQEADFTEFAAGQEIKGVLSFRPSLDRADLATRVEYYVNDQLRSTQTEQPFQFTWDTAVEGLREPKEFALKVKVYDAQGVASEQVWPARVLVPAKTLLQRILEVPVAILAILIGIGVLVLVWALYVLRARRLAAYPSGAWQRSSPLSSGGIGPSTTGAPPLPDQSTGWLSEGTTDPKGYPTVGTRETTVGMGGVNTVAVGQGYAGDRGEVSVAGAWLVMEGLPRPGYRYDLRADVVTLGRSTDCDIVVDDPAVSRQHARIQRQGTQFYLMDMGATNPTKVNGSPAGRVRLMDGDRIEVGRTVLIFKSAL